VQVQRLARRVPPDARDHRHPPPHRLHRELDHLVVLVEVQRRRFARRPHRDQAVDLARDLELDLVLQPDQIELAVAERGDHCGESAGKHSGGEL
jgi:hypothetical protein